MYRYEDNNRPQILTQNIEQSCLGASGGCGELICELPVEEEIKRTLKYGKPHQVIWAIFTEYCYKTTIHGFRYLGERNRFFVERFIWATIIILAVISCSHLIYNSWKKWESSPVIVTFDEKEMPIWKIPFPAVTICPQTKSSAQKFNYSEVIQNVEEFCATNESHLNISQEKLNYFRVMHQICSEDLDEQVCPIPINATIDAIQILSTLEPEFYVNLCKDENQDRCNKSLTKVLTDEGICYSFNILDAHHLYRDESLHDGFILDFMKRESHEWSVESGYRADSGVDTYPERALGAGVSHRLKGILLGNEEDLDYACGDGVQGFKILLHSPDEIPQMSQMYKMVPFEQDVTIIVKVNMRTTSENLRRYDPTRRQCFFDGEKNLRYFKSYTQRNCELECLTNYTFAKCGCVKFSMPRSNTTRVCDLPEKNCYVDAETELLQREFQLQLKKKTNPENDEESCNCLPACVSLSYDTEVFQTDLDPARLQFLKNVISKEEFELIDTKVSRITIFFQEEKFWVSKRNELFGITEFLSNCGGLFGLFMGISSLSFVEILYFCTIRLAYNLNLRSVRERQGSTFSTDSTESF